MVKELKHQYARGNNKSLISLGLVYQNSYKFDNGTTWEIDLELAKYYYLLAEKKGIVLASSLLGLLKYNLFDYVESLEHFNKVMDSNTILDGLSYSSFIYASNILIKLNKTTYIDKVINGLKRVLKGKKIKNVYIQ